MTETTITSLALPMLKTRLNRLSGDTALDETALLPRLRGGVLALKRNGIRLTDSTEDVCLLVDYAAWRYQNRDQPGEMPQWLRLLRRERFLTDPLEGGKTDEP